MSNSYSWQVTLIIEGNFKRFVGDRRMMPSGTEMTREQSQRVSTYFSRNYKPGERIKIPERSREKRKSPNSNGEGEEDWIEWMRRRLIEIGFYDKHGMRVGETNKIPPRIFLRGDATPEEEERYKIASSGIDDDHYEFKVWLQHKVEDARLGNGSIRFLASERPGNEYVEYEEAFNRLTDHFEELFEQGMDWECPDGRHLAILRKVIGRAEPDVGGREYDPSWHRKRGTFEYKTRKEIALMGEHRRRKSLTRKICQTVVRSLISRSKTKCIDEREVFLRRGREDGDGFFEWAADRGVNISSKEVEDEIQRRFTRNGQFGKEYAKSYQKRVLRKKEMRITEYREFTALELTVKRLIEEGEPPEDEWKEARISSPAIVLVPDLSSKIQRIISESREKLGEIVRACDLNFGEGGPDSDYILRDGLSKIDLLEDMGEHLRSSEDSVEDAIEQIMTEGFGGSQGGGETSKGADERDRHNSRKLAYNILTILQNKGMLSTMEMNREEYIQYFLEGDEEKLKPREGKRWPNMYIFSPELLNCIGPKVSPIHFLEGRENAIFRYLRGDSSRWMYCLPERHGHRDFLRHGGYLKDVQDGRCTERYKFKEDYEGFTSKVIVDGEEEEQPNRRCVPDQDIVASLNSLQDVQWEINLDLLTCFFDIEFADGKTLSDMEYEDVVKSGSLGHESIRKSNRLISGIHAKERFRGYFPEKAEDREDGARSIDWARKIVNHNANVFWHSWYCDFRGRMYPRCNNLSPIGSDLNKALIRFKHWKRMGENSEDDSGFYWMKIHVHNLMEGVSGNWGDDEAKKGAKFDERAAWVTRNEMHIREMAQRPDNFAEKLGLAKHKFGKREELQRLAAIIEFDRVLRCFEKQVDESGMGDWSKITSGLPIHLDASCNGYQHISTIFQDEKLAKKVNVIPTDDGPQDLYSEVANVARTQVDEEGKKFSADIKKFLEQNLDPKLSKIAFDRIFDRKIAKNPTMTRAYGSTRFTKSMSGRSGKGQSLRSEPQMREWTPFQKERIERIRRKHKPFLKAREEFKENPELGNKHYQKHALVFKKKPELLEILQNNGYRSPREKPEDGRVLRKNSKVGILIDLIEGDASISESAVAHSWDYSKVIIDGEKKDADNSEVKSTAKSWMNLLEEEEYFSLWARGSGLFWAILDDPDHPELKSHFWYDRENDGRCGHLWKKQHELTKMTVKAYKDAIEHVCGHVYGDFEIVMKSAVEKSKGKYPGVRWKSSSILENRESGFEVSNYYMKQKGGGSKGGWPTKVDSCYSGLAGLPIWYTESKIKNGWDENPKTRKRYEEKLGRFISGLGGIVPRGFKGWERRGNRGINEVLSWMLRPDAGDDSRRLSEQILQLRDLVSIRIDTFSEKEEERIDLDKMGSSICPNFIHSLDACHMRTVINRMSEESENLGFWAVHDSFGTHAVSIEKMRKAVIESFWEMHEGRDINWWLGELQGSEGILDVKKLKRVQSKIQGFLEARKSGKSEYLIS